MIRNIRDLSEIANEDGIALRRNCLIRSGHLHHAQPEELRGVSAVIDLRTPVETEKMPDRLPEWVSYHHIPLFDEAAAGITRKKNLSAVPDMRALYRTMIENEAFRGHIQEVLSLICTHDYTGGAVLWHCTAGKDRCGVISALVLRALGVSREAVMRDYLRSNDTCAEEAETVYRKLLQDGHPEHMANSVREVFFARPEYLQAAIAAHAEYPLVFPDSTRLRQAVLAEMN